MAFDPELGGQSPEEIAQQAPEALADVPPTTDLGTLMLRELGLGYSHLTETDQKILRLNDIQARHKQELHEAEVLWRISMEAGHAEDKNPGKALLPENTPFTVRVFQCYQKSQDKQVCIEGVRLVVPGLNAAGGFAEQIYNVIVSLDGKPYGIFRDPEVEVVHRQVEELEAMRTELRLNMDLTKVLAPVN